MVERPPINKYKYLATFGFTTLIFIIGVLIGLQFSDYTTYKFQSEQESLKIQLLSADLKNELFKDIQCDLKWSSIWDDKVALGNRIENLEKSQGQDDPNLLIQKEFYQLIQIRTWLLLKDFKKECNTNQSIILFFYTNNEDKPVEKDLSEKQGLILDELYTRYPDRIAIFAFEININNSALNALKSIYNVSKSPTLIIDERYYEGLISSKELENISNLR